MHYTVPTGVRIGHIHLKVSNIEKALSFYKDILGFQITQKIADSAVFLSAGGYHHHIGLNTWESKGASSTATFGVGLYHVAFLYPTRKDLATTLKQLITVHYPIDGFADHGVSEAIYLKDPDGNGVELYWDKSQALWPKDKDGNIQMYSRSLDIENLLSELD